MKHISQANKYSRVVLISAIAVAVAGLVFLRFDVSNRVPDVTNYSASPLVLDRGGILLHASLSGDDEWCIPISLDKMGKWTARAAVEIEDKRFYRHRGIDWIALLRSAVYNLKEGRVVTGASTITSQLIRIARPRPRTFATKASEFWMAMKLERSFSKDAILELYLNRAPFGGNVRGIEAAARIYLGKRAESLSLGESVALLSLLPAPSRFRPDRYPDRAREVRDADLKRLRERGLVAEADYTAALAEGISGGRYALPRDAHFAAARFTGHQHERITNSTISVEAQKMLERKLEQALAAYPQKITASAIIVENKSREVLAYVGNGRFGSEAAAAYVDCGASPRSPGSALKPFIYATAIERGLLTPASLLADTPIAFRGSAPRNFDMSYRGPVSARSALVASLNAPAVRVLRSVGYERATAKLRLLGFESITKQGAEYADALVLGGCEVSVTELAAAYATLAGEGVYSDLSWKLNSPLQKRQVLSPDACYVTLDMLKDTGRILPIYREIMKDKNIQLAFKTGTSYGLRDAWAAGVSPSHTVVVWMGIPSGAGAGELIGLNAAVPPMLNIFQEIPLNSTRDFKRPKSIFTRKVCAISGSLPLRYCASLISDFAIRNVSSNEICKIHKYVDGKVITDWPDELKYWFASDSTSTSEGRTVKIVRPIDRSKIILDPGQNSKKINLRAEGSGNYNWYLDGKYIATDDRGLGIFMEVSKGFHKLTVLSGSAQDSIEFEVVEAMEAVDNFEMRNRVLD